jgi:hypothetical protein
MIQEKKTLGKSVSHISRRLQWRGSFNALKALFYMITQSTGELPAFFPANQRGNINILKIRD